MAIFSYCHLQRKVNGRKKNPEYKINKNFWVLDSDPHCK